MSNSRTRRSTPDASRRKKPGRALRICRTKHLPFPIVLSSPSGAGKTSIARGVVARDAGVRYSVSATTRPIRPGERHGRDYYFYSPARFKAKQRAGQLLETAEVYGYTYGTPKPPILLALKQGCDVIADLDVQGARSMRKLVPGSVTIFITTPDNDELQRRLRNRRTDSPAVIEKRLACARQELNALPEFDYVVVNRSLAEAIEDVMTIIRAERLRTRRWKIRSE
jgi:guanylate kinase